MPTGGRDREPSIQARVAYDTARPTSDGQPSGGRMGRPPFGYRPFTDIHAS